MKLADLFEEEKPQTTLLGHVIKKLLKDEKRIELDARLPGKSRRIKRKVLWLNGDRLVLLPHGLNAQQENLMLTPEMDDQYMVEHDPDDEIYIFKNM